jgi:hypothetical protein
LEKPKLGRKPVAPTKPSAGTSTVQLKLSDEVLALCEPDGFDPKNNPIPQPPQLQELRFNPGEDQDFTPLPSAAKDIWAYQTAGGWDVIIQEATVKAK